MKRPPVEGAASATRLPTGPDSPPDAEHADAVRTLIRAGVLVPLVELERVTGVDRKSLTSLLERHDVPTFRNPSRRGRVAERARVETLVRDLKAAGGSSCDDCGERTGSVTAQCCARCTEGRRVRGLQDWHRTLSTNPDRHKAFYAERSATRRPLPDEAVDFQRERIRRDTQSREAAIGERWTRADAAAFLGVAKRTVVEHEEAGRFAPVERIRTAFGFPIPVYDPRDIKAYAKGRAGTLDARTIQASVQSLTGSTASAIAAAHRVEQREETYRRIRIGVSGRSRKDDIRELLAAAAAQAVYHHLQNGAIAELTYTALCVEVAQAIWQDQVRRQDFYWLPADWAASADPWSFAASYRENAVARVQRLAGAEVKKALQSGKTKLVA